MRHVIYGTVRALRGPAWPDALWAFSLRGHLLWAASLRARRLAGPPRRHLIQQSSDKNLQTITSLKCDFGLRRDIGIPHRKSLYYLFIMLRQNRSVYRASNEPLRISGNDDAARSTRVQCMLPTTSWIPRCSVCRKQQHARHPCRAGCIIISGNSQELATRAVKCNERGTYKHWPSSSRRCFFNRPVQDDVFITVQLKKTFP